MEDKREVMKCLLELEDQLIMNLYIESPFLDDFESLEEQLYLRRDIPDRKKFSNCLLYTSFH